MSVPLGTVRLAPGRDASARDGHPWVFSRALAGNQPLPEDGAVVRVVAADGSPLGTAGYSARSEMALRFFASTSSGDGEVDLSVDGLAARFTALAAAKEALVGPGTDAYRLVHGEGDHLPGLIVDRYGATFVLQISTATMDRLRSAVVTALRDAFSPAAIVERSTSSARGAEGLSDVAGLVLGELPDPLTIREGESRLVVDALGGQKTGFFLDQRDTRAALARHAAGRTLLNVCCYSGAFTVAAAKAGLVASTNVDSSAPALDLLRQNLTLNGLPQSAHETVTEDVARALKSLRDRGRSYDLLVVDPPAFVKRRADLGAGGKAYVKTNAHAMRLAAPGAVLLTCSCSQFVEEDQFRGFLMAAAAEAHRDVTVLQKLHQAPDHTMRVTFPEGTYLKAWLLQVA